LTARGLGPIGIRPGLDRKVRVLFACAVLALLVVGLIGYRGMVVSRQSDGWVRHTHEVLESLQDLRMSVAGIESSYRALALNGQDSEREVEQASVLRAAQDAATVRSLTADNPAQQRRLPGLERLLAEETRLAHEVDALRGARGMQAAATAVRSGPHSRIMREFQAVVGELQDEELRLLVARDADAKRRLNQTRTVLIFGTALGLFIATAAGVSVERDSNRRGRAEVALRLSEERHRMLVQAIRDYAIVMMSPRGEIMSWNPGAELMAGRTAAEMIGRNFSVSFSKDDIERGRPQQILALAAVKGVHDERGTRLRGDGTPYQVCSSFSTLRDPSGELVGFSVISRDLAGSAESEAKYRGLLEAAPDAMVVVNPAGNIVLLNVQAEKQFGYHRDELVGQPVKNIIPDGFAERLIADGTRSAADALAQQIGTGIELTARRKDGTEFPIEMMLSPLRSPEGVLVTAAIRDISVRRAAERHLAQMESRYRGLLEAAPDAMVVVDPDGRIVLLNVQAEKQFGYSRDELLGQQVKSLIPEGFAERLVADGLRSAEEAIAQQIGTGIELTGRRKNGSAFPIEIMLSPLESADGVLVTAAIRDITARIAAEAELLQSVEELKRSNVELGQFAYIASHDLQEPLRMVASYTQLLSRRYKGKLDAEADEFIAFAVDGANRMQRLIQDLLLYSRVGTKGRELLATSSENTLAQALVNLRGAIEDSGAQVTHDPLPAVLADEMQLTQLFQNLIGNAIKYQNPGIPRVHVSAVKNGGKKWVFSVQDNGMGIDPKYFKKIFGMFQRLHKREEFEGTGIGLAICKKIVERHGGVISVESLPGRGSAFSFALAASEMKA
jgi:PAS domain S-box-containing protein